MITMKLKSEREGSVLIVSLLTITILTMICATSLHITSQNANATTQTASWQQSLAGAESAVDQAMSELNTRMRSGGAWASGWYTAQMPLPTTKPTDTSVPATDFPPAGSYNYYTPPTLAVSPNSGLQDESGQTVATWVTVDTGGLPLPKGSETYQAYRIRATGVVRAPGPARVSNRKLDNELRKISLKFDRFSGTAVTTPQAARRIEVIATPVINSRFQRAITLQNWLVMNGTSSIVDSFDSSNPFKSTNGQYPATELSTKRQSNGDVGLVSSAKNNNVSNLKDNAVYGSREYSGPAVKKPGGVKGSVSTPFNTTIPVASDPSGTFTVYGSNYENATVVASGTASSPTRLKIPQNFSLQHNFTITGPTLAPGETAQDTYLEISV